MVREHKGRLYQAIVGIDTVEIVHIVDQAAIWEMVRTHMGRLYQAIVGIDTVEIV